MYKNLESLLLKCCTFFYYSVKLLMFSLQFKFPKAVNFRFQPDTVMHFTIWLHEIKSSHIKPCIACCLLFDDPSLTLDLSDAAHYHSQFLWKIRHQVYLNTISHLPNISSLTVCIHLDKSRCLTCFNVGIPYF